MENTDLGGFETIIVHVGTNDLMSTRNLDWIMGKAYDFVPMVKKIQYSRQILSGVIRRRDAK